MVAYPYSSHDIVLKINAHRGVPMELIHTPQASTGLCHTLVNISSPNLTVPLDWSIRLEHGTSVQSVPPQHCRGNQSCINRNIDRNRDFIVIMYILYYKRGVDVK